MKFKMVVACYVRLNHIHARQSHFHTFILLSSFVASQQHLSVYTPTMRLFSSQQTYLTRTSLLGKKIQNGVADAPILSLRMWHTYTHTHTHTPNNRPTPIELQTCTLNKHTHACGPLNTSLHTLTPAHSPTHTNTYTHVYTNPHITKAYMQRRRIYASKRNKGHSFSCFSQKR